MTCGSCRFLAQIVVFGSAIADCHVGPPCDSILYCQNWEIEIDMQQKRMDIEATPGKSIVCLGYDWKQAKINLSSKFLWPKNGLLHMDLPAIVKWYRCMQIQLKSLYAGSHQAALSEISSILEERIRVVSSPSETVFKMLQIFLANALAHQPTSWDLTVSREKWSLLIRYCPCLWSEEHPGWGDGGIQVSYRHI